MDCVTNQDANVVLYVAVGRRLPSERAETPVLTRIEAKWRLCQSGGIKRKRSNLLDSALHSQ